MQHKILFVLGIRVTRSRGASSMDKLEKGDNALGTLVMVLTANSLVILWLTFNFLPLRLKENFERLTF